MSHVETWNPWNSLVSSEKSAKFAVILLNTELQFDRETLQNIWNNAQIRITVDGGTQRWLNWLKYNNLTLHDVRTPDLITGDMDSLPKDTLDLFLKHCHTCQAVETPDQNETDFTKSLRELDVFAKANNIALDFVLVVSESSGRLDQILANINTLYKADDIVGGTKIFLLASNSLTWLLHSGVHSIRIPPVLRETKQWCALIPLNLTPVVSTTGLKWNLDNSKMAFGSMVSTSNTYDDSSHTVTVKTDSNIIWSMGIDGLFYVDYEDSE